MPNTPQAPIATNHTIITGPTISANCAGDRVGTTPVSTAIPTVPPLHATWKERVTGDP